MNSNVNNILLTLEYCKEHRDELIEAIRRANEMSYMNYGNQYSVDVSVTRHDVVTVCPGTSGLFFVTDDDILNIEQLICDFDPYITDYIAEAEGDTEKERIGNAMRRFVNEETALGEDVFGYFYEYYENTFDDCIDAILRKLYEEI